MMRKMLSSVSTVVAPGQRKAVGEAYRQDQRGRVAHAATEIRVQGVPGEPDHHRFLTGPFEGLLPVQSGVGNALVGSIAVNTNKDQWQDYRTSYFNGIFAQVGRFDPPAFDSAERVSAPPSKAVTTNSTTAKGFTVGVIQDTDIN
jgi:type II secretory pathway pseudopilin PulG